eukprot:TRINITY_DN50985_c0_g1_i1.p1 TRINITY_DN50985_c0_g1~~TRINITY_DN50985_c0_g1_i1.p1  ORF type:complete len:334 (+),score=70.47 TRINITY_DN50985_c0_g1_i1:114-1115(+)
MVGPATCPAGMEEELGWFQQLERTARKLSGSVEKQSPQKKLPYAAEADMEWRSFELAEAMELGFAKEVTTSYIKAQDAGLAEKRLLIERSKDKAQYVLMTEIGEPLLMARGPKDGSRLEMFIPTGGDPPTAVGPAFTLTATDANKTSWVLMGKRCSCDEYIPENRRAIGASSSKACKQEILRLEQSKTDVRGCKVMNIDVHMPALSSEGIPEPACQGCLSPLSRRSTRCSSSSMSDCSESACDEKEPVRLVSRLPRWSPKLQSLTQDFYGRCKLASSKNIQLDTPVPQGQTVWKDKPVLLHGKAGPDTYVLDYKHPLGMAQAFAIALTTQGWP